MEATGLTGIEIALPGGVTVTLPVGTSPREVGAYIEALPGIGRQGATALPTDSPYLTVEQAAQYLGFPKKRIYNLTSTGAIPHRKQDGRLLFRRDELDAWLDQFYAGPDWAGPGALADL